MTATIHEVLGELRAAALDERDKGDKFERLMAAYLRTDPEWASKFEEVWLWPEWPGRAGVRDIGIDLVARTRDDGGFAAIQCKFYGAGHRVGKGDIDSFLAASMRPDFGFTQRYIFDTSAGWSGNAEEELVGVVQRVDIGYLDDAAFDWSAYDWRTPEVLVPTGKKQPRPHQLAAMEDVFTGLQVHDRGKLIMACGTGKTFTSLKIAEHLVGAGGRVLFLVPSIQLLSQSLREWMANAEVEIRPFAVCSDVRVGRRAAGSRGADDADISTIDLTEPATTDAATLVERMSAGRHAAERMTVVFATYQSIDVIIDAQRQGVGAFDLVICDEAHRTTGVTLADGDESAFVKVHDNSQLRAAKRLYMTATPRVFGEDVRTKAKDSDAVLADMGDEGTYGPELHRLGFGDAVEADLLTDYKVLVLAVDEQHVADHFQQAMTNAGEIPLDEAAKLIGCWNGLRKHFRPPGGPASSVEPAEAPMRTAVAFAKDIRASKAAAQAFPTMVDAALLRATDDRPRLRVEAEHVDGTMGIHERNAHLGWLKAQAPDDTCRILTNAKCLSEGVDVPALDAVLFLTPRGSQVDVVQSVGRVMRKAPGKQLGYIILPIVVPSGVAPEDALRDNERYKVVWQVLQALRSHDERFHAMVNQIDLNKQKPDRLVIDDVTPRDETAKVGEGPSDRYAENLGLDLRFDGFRDAMYARIVQKVGERRYWETWAKDVADIANRHMVRIRGLLKDPESPQSLEFAEFLKGLRANLNDGVSTDDAIEMLAQHLVTRPIFDALFESTSFVETNPVAKIMELMLASLDEVDMSAERENLEPFYASVRRRAAGVDNAEGKQRILVELYDKFFSAAFRKTVDKLGIVYTPIEIVDFILRSADVVMRQEFGRGLTDEGVHVLDGFTGTGTFLVRLLQSGLIEPSDLERKYAAEMAGQEILLLAYYIAAANLQMAYEDLTGEAKPFPHLALADTFQNAEEDDPKDLLIFTDNNSVLSEIDAMKIDVIVGNPPYSSGQDSANDNNANEKYPHLDASIRKAYADRSTATNKNSLYDSYIRAIRWATERIGERGVIAFVTNGGFLDSNTADGMRKSLAEEFSAIHIYNLRGNQRTAGEQSRKEGGKVFGAGSRATVAITVLVKNPDLAGAATIHYTDVGDYLTTDQKLAKVAAAVSIAGLEPQLIVPNEHGDWLNQRRDDFGAFASLESLFDLSAYGLLTARDSWVYNSSAAAVAASVSTLVGAYKESVRSAERVLDKSRISWSQSLETSWAKRVGIDVDDSRIRVATYRPFFKQELYFDQHLNHRRGLTPRLSPSPLQPNRGFYALNPGSDKPFSVLMVESIPDVALYGSNAGQWYTRYRYEPVDSGMLDLVSTGSTDEEPVIDGYRRIDNITDEALAKFRAAYPDLDKLDHRGTLDHRGITKDDVFFYVYGLLHSPTYRETYAADLKKMLPRIPFVTDFRGFAEAGRRLSELHLGYESVTPYPLDGLDVDLDQLDQRGIDPYAFFAVKDKKMQFAKVRIDGKLVPDRSTIVYNDRITLSGIPEEAYRYQLGSRSAIEWIIDRYWIKTDKASGIVNDPNDWSREVGDPRYIIDLLARIVTVSLETMKIVDALPPFEVKPHH